MRYDVVIIGAGVSGIAAGIRLAHFGKKTLILERHYRVGGLNSFYRAGGYDLDVGLHAITNYDEKWPKSAPMARLLRRLRIRKEELGLFPQRSSRIAFPGVNIDFTNNYKTFVANASAIFKGQERGLLKLALMAEELYRDGYRTDITSAREVLSGVITEPLLVEMILCPLMYYGNPEEDDMDYAQFALMFKSIFIEGFARPRQGVRPILDLLVRRFEQGGGRLRLRSGVKRVQVENGSVAGVILDDGERIECDVILSSAGLLETVMICPESKPADMDIKPGRMSFAESISILDRPAAEMGVESTIIFYNDSEKLVYRKSEEPVDVRSGVICVPGNFLYDEPIKNDMIRFTNIANPDYWENVDDAEYEAMKELWRNKALDVAGDLLADSFNLRELMERMVFTDTFTPRTLHRFTGHINGAVYGSPVKIRDGRTAVDNLYICGTDQGFLGIIGAMIGGVEMANYGFGAGVAG